MSPLPAASDPNSIRSMFDAIAGRYDLANTVLSGGAHYLWRQRVVNTVPLPPHAQIFDGATGTGDLAFAWAKKAGAGSTIVGLDFSEGMLTEARHKVKNYERLGAAISFLHGDLLSLPFENARFDVASVSFGIRNVADPRRALAELLRVVKPGGSVLILEFGSRPEGLLGQLFTWYSRTLLPKIGGLLTGREEAYRYLDKSSTEFPAKDAFLGLAPSGTMGSFTALWGGIAYLYQLRKST